MFIPGPIGQLEAIVENLTPDSERVAIICHPHPLHEGTMHNKVVTTIAKAFALKNYATVRFNYRGVGQSAGKYGEISGEVDDCLSVYNWVMQQAPNVKIALAGFSFGGFISAGVANQKPCTQLISIAPAVNHAKFTTLKNITCPWTIVQGEADELVPFLDVKNFIDHTDNKINLIVMPGASHFFHGKLIELREVLLDAIF